MKIEITAKEKMMFFVWMINMIITAFCVKFLDGEVPVHFGMDGKPDRYGSKYELLGICMIYLSAIILLEVIILSYRKKCQNSDDEIENKDVVVAKQNEKVLAIVGVTISFFFLIVQMIILYLVKIDSKEALAQINMQVIYPIESILFGIVFLIFGNYSTKIRRNAVIGLRTRWSMENDVTWSKSNRIAGYLAMICGLLMIISGFIFYGIASVLVMLGIMIVFTIICVIVSYKVYQKYK